MDEPDYEECPECGANLQLMPHYRTCPMADERDDDDDDDEPF